MGTRLWPIIELGYFKDTDTKAIIQEAYSEVPMDGWKYWVLEEDLAHMVNTEYNGQYPIFCDEYENTALEVDYALIKELINENHIEFMEDFNNIPDTNGLKKIILDYIKSEKNVRLYYI